MSFRLSLLAAASRRAPAPPVGNAYVQAVLADSPWAYWRLNESPSNGNLALDSSGNGRNASFAGASGSAYESTPGLSPLSDTAIMFKGSGFAVSPKATLAVNQAFTIETMMMASSVVENENILGGDNGASDRRWQWRITSSGRLQFLTIYPNIESVVSNYVVTDGLPHLIHLVFDPSLSAQDGICKIYVDGALDSQSNIGLTIDPGTVTPVIAARTSVGNNPFTGTLDEVALYLSALSQERISAHFNAANF